MGWFGAEWHKLVIAFAGLCHLWDKSADIVNFVRRRKLQRRSTMPTALADLQLAIAAAAELREALPLLAQGAADLKQAYADKKDPTKAAADLDAALGVIVPLIEKIIPLLPAASVPPTAA